MFITTTHSANPAVHARRAAGALGAMIALELVGSVALPDAVALLPPESFEAGATILWTLWAVPLTVLAVVLASATISADRCRPATPRDHPQLRIRRRDTPVVSWHTGSSARVPLTKTYRLSAA